VVAELDGELSAFFRRVEASDFLAGRRTDWRADFDWILEPKHLTKILEGVYDNRNRGDPGTMPKNVADGLALVTKLEAEEVQNDAGRNGKTADSHRGQLPEFFGGRNQACGMARDAGRLGLCGG
jgi:hypothetical protein